MSPKTLIEALRTCEYRRGMVHGNFNFAVRDEYIAKAIRAARLADKIEKRLLEIVDPHKRLQRIIQKKIDADPEIKALKEKISATMNSRYLELGLRGMIVSGEE